VVRAGWREGGVPGGEIGEQSTVGKGQIKYCRAVITGGREPGVDSGSIEERKQQS